MRILFDQGTLAQLRKHLSDCTVETAGERGWSTLENGELLSAAEAAGFDVLLTTDSNLRYQQSLATRRIAIVVSPATSWPRVRKAISRFDEALSNAETGSYPEVAVPW